MWEKKKKNYTPPHGTQHHLAIWRKNHCKAFGWSSTGDGVGSGSSDGRCRWNASTAAVTPSSSLINFATSIARDFTTGWSMNFMAFDKFSRVSWEIGIGAGPSPFWYILSPQKNWSPKNGTMVVGHPAFSPVAVVPAPPWCTTAEHWGNNQSWGHPSRRKTLSGTSVKFPRFPHPRSMIPRCSVSFRASIITSVALLGSSRG